MEEAALHLILALVLMAIMDLPAMASTVMMILVKTEEAV